MIFKETNSQKSNQNHHPPKKKKKKKLVFIRFPKAAAANLRSSGP